MEGNAILRRPTLTILQQIEELKLWHKQQESKMIENEQNDKGGRNVKVVKNAKEKTLQTSKEDNVPKHQINFDELPIKTTNPNLYNVIENNIIPNNTPSENVKNSNEQNGKPKFKFLKKGEGIARFRMGPSKKPKYRSTQSNSLKLTGISPKNNINQQSKDNHEQILSRIGINESIDKIPTLKPPDLKLDLKKKWKSIFDSGKAEDLVEKAIDSNMLDIFQPNSTIDSSTVSLLEKFMLVGEFVKEKEEQRIFNLMEQHVLDSSFSSTSTYVENLMKNAIISTPVKNQPSRQPVLSKEKTCQKELSACESENEVYAMKLKDVNDEDKSVLNDRVSTIEEQSKEIEENSLDHSVHVRFAEQVDYKSFTDVSQSFNNSAPKELPNSAKEIDECDDWKDDSSSCCSQCDAENDSSNEDDDVLKSKTSTKYPSHNSKPPLSNCSNNDSNTQTSNSTEKLQSVVAMSKEDIELEDSITEPCNCAATVILKKNELEREIKIYQIENNTLKKMRENLERERKQFQRERNKFLKELDEERKKNILQLDEERKKLAKEKSVFERYSKSLSKNPTREDRREIQALQDQIKEMKQELNKKETRWGSAQARVRNQVKVLEEDNKKLKEEIEVLRKQAKHLEFMSQKRTGKPFNNTKLIHDINNHVSKIVIEDGAVSKEAQEVGYFKPNASVKSIAIDQLNPSSLPSVKVLKGNCPNSMATVNDNSINKIVASDQSANNLNSLNYLLDSTKESLGQEVTSVPQKSLTEPEKSKTSLSPNACKEIVTVDGNVELTYSDGRKEIRYKNGNIKKIDLYTGSEKMIYFNGDVREVTKDGTIKYFYFETRTWQTTLPDGLEIFDFPNQHVEKRHKNGMVESLYPDGKKQITFPDGYAEIHYPDDGRVLQIYPDTREQVLILPNGQKEFRTDDYVRREYPDGTQRIVRSDGTIETKYANGRVRLKDKQGNLVLDTGLSSMVDND